MISLAIFLVLLYLIIVEWYPSPYFETDGGWYGIKLMFGIDMVLGPLFTFLVFNRTKRRREIIMDLSIIVVIQLSALVWGISTVYGQRPVAVVAFDGTLSPVSADTFGRQGIGLSVLKQFGDRRPPIVYQRVPIGDELIESMRLAKAGWPRSAQIFLYRPLRESLSELFTEAAAVETKLVTRYPELKDEFQRLRVKHVEDVAFLPISGRFMQAIVALSPSGEILESIPAPQGYFALLRKGAMFPEATIGGD